MGSLKKYMLLSILFITTTIFGAVLWYSFTQLTDVVEKNRLEERVSFVMENATSIERLLFEVTAPANDLLVNANQGALTLGRPHSEESLKTWVSHMDALLLQSQNLYSDQSEIHVIFLDEKENPLPRGIHYIDTDFDGYWDPGHIDEEPLNDSDLKTIKQLMQNSASSKWLQEGLSSHAFITGSYLWSYARVSTQSLKPFAIIILTGTSSLFKDSLYGSTFDPAPSIALIDLKGKAVMESPDYNPDQLKTALSWENTTYQDRATLETYKIYQNKDSELKVLSREMINGWTLIYKLPKDLIQSDFGSRMPYILLMTLVYILTTAFIGTQLAKYYDNPLQDLVRLLDTTTDATENFPLAPSQYLNRKDEIGLLLQAFNELSQSLNQSRSDVYSLQKSLEQQIEEKGRALKHTHQLLSQSVEKLADQNKQLESVHTLLSSNAKVIQDSRSAMMRLEKMASLKFLVSGVAHELNTPIGNAITLSTFMEQELNHMIHDLSHAKNFKKDRLIESVRTMRDSIRQLESNINQSQEIILQIEQLGRLDHSEQTKCFAIAPFLKEIATTIALDAPMPIEVIVESHYLFDLVNTDPAKMMQLIKPLVQNSIDHGFASRESGKIHMILYQDADGLLLEYRDNGIGLSDEILNHMLTPFYSSAFGSHKGLGLNYVYNLCTQYFQGSFEASNAPEGGFLAQCLLRGIARCE